MIEEGIARLDPAQILHVESAYVDFLPADILIAGNLNRYINGSSFTTFMLRLKPEPLFHRTFRRHDGCAF